MNGSKHPAPFREETFGVAGARVGGKPTIGNVLLVPMPDVLGAAAGRWLGR